LRLNVNRNLISSGLIQIREIERFDQFMYKIGPGPNHHVSQKGQAANQCKQILISAQNIKQETIYRRRKRNKI